MSNVQTELHREVVEALVSSKAINFDAVGSVLSKYGARAALTGDAVGVIIGKNVMDICIPVDFHELFRSVNVQAAAGGQVKG